MLRHACGYALADKGLDTRTLQAYLGHSSINSTTRYAALAPGRFKKHVWAGVGVIGRPCGGFILASRATIRAPSKALLGHRNIQSTVRYTELAPNRFKNFWRD